MNQKPKSKPSRRAEAIPPFHVMDLLARAQAMEQAGRDVIHLEVGEPDFPTADPVIEAARKALDERKTFYTPARGLPELREKVASYYAERFGVTVDAARIVITTGASSALLLALSAVTDTGDEVLLPDPGYPCNANIARSLGLEVTPVPVDHATAYQLDVSLVEANWTDKTRVVMVSSPSNPTGTMLTEQDLLALAAVIRDRGGVLIVDEIYQGLVYQGEDRTALSQADDVIVINSFSKYFGMTGWRLGWMVLPESLVDAVDRLAQNIYLAPPTLSQYAALAAFSDEVVSIQQERVGIFDQRRRYLLEMLPELGFEIRAEPAGAFYIYAGCERLTEDAYRWCHGLLEAEAVAVTPGVDFGQYAAAGHVRFAYTRPIERLQEAVSRITKYINKVI